MEKSRENLTTEFEKGTNGTSRSHLMRDTNQKYQAVMQQSEEESETNQNTQLSSESEQKYNRHHQPTIKMK